MIPTLFLCCYTAYVVCSPAFSLSSPLLKLVGLHTIVSQPRLKQIFKGKSKLPPIVLHEVGGVAIKVRAKNYLKNRYNIY